MVRVTWKADAHAMPIDFPRPRKEAPTAAQSRYDQACSLGPRLASAAGEMLIVEKWHLRREINQAKKALSESGAGLVDCGAGQPLRCLCRSNGAC